MLCLCVLCLCACCVCVCVVFVCVVFVCVCVVLFVSDPEGILISHVVVCEQRYCSMEDGCIAVDSSS